MLEMLKIIMSLRFRSYVIHKSEIGEVVNYIHDRGRVKIKPYPFAEDKEERQFYVANVLTTDLQHRKIRKRFDIEHECSII